MPTLRTVTEFHLQISFSSKSVYAPQACDACSLSQAQAKRVSFVIPQNLDILLSFISRRRNWIYQILKKTRKKKKYKQTNRAAPTLFIGRALWRNEFLSLSLSLVCFSFLCFVSSFIICVASSSSKSQRYRVILRSDTILNLFLDFSQSRYSSNLVLFSFLCVHIVFL